jgi:hypothetical protein
MSPLADAVHRFRSQEGMKETNKKPKTEHDTIEEAA